MSHAPPKRTSPIRDETSSRTAADVPRSTSRKRLRTALVAIVALLAAGATLAPVESASAAPRHRVRIHRGDTMFGIHLRVHRSVRCIARRNHIRNANRIRAGHTLRVPSHWWCVHFGGRHHARHHRHHARHRRPSRSAHRAPLRHVQTPGAYKRWARAHVGRGQFPALRQLWNHESGWRHRAANPYSGAYGIPQALPGGKMASAGGDWRSNGYTQMRWGLHYIRARYGSPARAWAFWQRHHWY